ncbi:exodeoxyribonuclease VIII [Buttiauxella sp. BIGb0471]|uniref:PD-(D/E)XK nuclease-like domain-containing protein n=1 Tax=Buttiauxella sp. BIGb0471 TaxID=2940597 RepID=UPI0038575AC7|nr:exodeoxyribonuclease VIII [Buttiauxella sp. BIGb0471]
MLKARKNSGIKDLFFWCDEKTEARAKLRLQIAMEDAEIEVGRGHDYQLPIRTDVPVFDDLPKEGVLDETWCDRYELGDDSKTWQKIAAAESKEPETKTVETTSDVKVPSREQVSERLDEMRNLSDDDIIDTCKLPLATQIAHFWLGGMYTATPIERKAATAAAMDTDNSYLQNVILAFNSVESCKHCYDHIRQGLIENIHTIWPIDGKSPELNLVLTFTQEWMAAINDSSDTDGVKRKSVTEKWLTRYRKERTSSGATAGGLNKTDRSPDLEHTLDTLDEEIACALLPMDFNIYNIPGSIHRRGKEMVAAKESPWKEWSRKLRHCPGILDYSRAAIFAVVRSAAPNIHMMPGTHQAWINAKLTETDHANPSAETLAIAMGSAATGASIETSNHASSEQASPDLDSTSIQPEVKRISATVFSIEGLMGDQKIDNPAINTPSNEVEKQEKQPVETVNDEPMETTDGNEIASGVEISAGESIAADGEEVIVIEQPTAEFPAYFEPGRYEGLPNEVYHGANGISSTQVKDARVSLMYFHGRHIAKTIGRETSEAFTFGTLVHALALEPETLETDFAVFPGIPDGAFTNTDSLKAFIREYNEGKDKSEQLKLTGTKDVLSSAILTVKPDAIFADEFEQQWNEANQDKIILSERQLTHAKAIQQALFNHPSAGQLLQHPNRANEVSYFGMDEETGLEVRVRPDLEIDMSGVRIGVDLKTISLGKVKQDFLRAKLHREIIERDYHLSAAMYCDVADFNQFFWIFVNKDEGYHWVAIIEASEELLELGRLEYRKAINAISNALDTNVWPAPIAEDYTDELNDFDLRRLESLRLA